MIKLQKLFTFRDSWPWALVLSIITLPCIKAITYNNGHLPTGAWLSIIGAIVAAWSITAWRFILRARWIDSIKFYTERGIAVSGDTTKVPITFSVDLDNAVDEVVTFWNGKEVTPKVINRSDCYNALNGGTLTLSSTPIKLQSSGSIDGTAPSFTAKLVRGFAFGSEMAIYIDPTSYDQTIRVFKHEVGHVCLDTIGVTDETYSHQVMNDNKFGY